MSIAKPHRLLLAAVVTALVVLPAPARAADPADAAQAGQDRAAAAIDAHQPYGVGTGRKVG